MSFRRWPFPPCLSVCRSHFCSRGLPHPSLVLRWPPSGSSLKSPSPAVMSPYRSPFSLNFHLVSFGRVTARADARMFFWLIAPCSSCCDHPPSPKNTPTAQIAQKYFCPAVWNLLEHLALGIGRFGVTCPRWKFHALPRFHFTRTARSPNI